MLNKIFFSLLIFLLVTDWPLINKFVYFPTGIRHLAVILSFLVLALLSKSRVVPKLYTQTFGIIIIWAAISIFQAQNGLYAYFMGFLFTYYFVITHVFGYMYEAKHTDIHKLLKYFVFIIFLLSLQPFFSGIIEGTSLRWLPGIFRELGAFALMMNLALIASITLYSITRKKIYVYLSIFFIICITMTVLKKSIFEYMFVITFAGLFLFKTGIKGKLKYFFWSIFFMVIIGAAFFGEFQTNMIENYEYLDRVGAEGHVRLGMYLASIDMAIDFFPYGVGYGSFGSLASIIDVYSPVYYLYGVDAIGSNSISSVEDGAHTLLDTFWPHVIGEAGFIGFIMYLLLLMIPIYRAYNLGTRFELNRPYAFFIIATLAVIYLDGIALYSPEIPIFVMLGAGLSGIILRMMTKLESKKA
jgi:hypothetical protein